MVEWGEKIPVNGVRPAWLRDSDSTAIRWAVASSEWDFSVSDNPYWKNFHSGDWRAICAIRLPADHWAYAPLRRGFTPWAGGSEAPADWDGGGAVCRNGSVARCPSYWTHRPNPDWSGQWDVIGYRQRAAEQPEEIPQWYLDRASEIIGTGVFFTDAMKAAIARYVMQHEQPPVDPDVLAVREILTAWHGENLPDAAIVHDDFQAALAAYRKAKAA